MVQHCKEFPKIIERMWIANRLNGQQTILTMHLSNDSLISGGQTGFSRAASRAWTACSIFNSDIS